MTAMDSPEVRDLSSCIQPDTFQDAEVREFASVAQELLVWCEECIAEAELARALPRRELEIFLERVSSIIAEIVDGLNPIVTWIARLQEKKTIPEDLKSETQGHVQRLIKVFTTPLQRLLTIFDDGQGRILTDTISEYDPNNPSLVPRREEPDRICQRIAEHYQNLSDRCIFRQFSEIFQNAADRYHQQATEAQGNIAELATDATKSNLKRQRSRDVSVSEGANRGRDIRDNASPMKRPKINASLERGGESSGEYAQASSEHIETNTNSNSDRASIGRDPSNAEGSEGWPDSAEESRGSPYQYGGDNTDYDGEYESDGLSVYDYSAFGGFSSEVHFDRSGWVGPPGDDSSTLVVNEKFIKYYNKFLWGAFCFPKPVRQGQYRYLLTRANRACEAVGIEGFGSLEPLEGRTVLEDEIRPQPPLPAPKGWSKSVHNNGLSTEREEDNDIGEIHDNGNSSPDPVTNSSSWFERTMLRQLDEAQNQNTQGGLRAIVASPDVIATYNQSGLDIEDDTLFNNDIEYDRLNESWSTNTNKVVQPPAVSLEEATNDGSEERIADDESNDDLCLRGGGDARGEDSESIRSKSPNSENHETIIRESEREIASSDDNFSGFKTWESLDLALPDTEIDRREAENARDAGKEVLADLLVEDKKIRAQALIDLKEAFQKVHNSSEKKLENARGPLIEFIDNGLEESKGAMNALLPTEKGWKDSHRNTQDAIRSYERQVDRLRSVVAELAAVDRKRTDLVTKKQDQNAKQRYHQRLKDSLETYIRRLRIEILARQWLNLKSRNTIEQTRKSDKEALKKDINRREIEIKNLEEIIGWKNEMILGSRVSTRQPKDWDQLSNREKHRKKQIAGEDGQEKHIYEDAGEENGVLKAGEARKTRKSHRNHLEALIKQLDQIISLLQTKHKAHSDLKKGLENAKLESFIPDGLQGLMPFAEHHGQVRMLFTSVEQQTCIDLLRDIMGDLRKQKKALEDRLEHASDDDGESGSEQEEVDEGEEKGVHKNDYREGSGKHNTSDAGSITDDEIPDARPGFNPEKPTTDPSGQFADGFYDGGKMWRVMNATLNLWQHAVPCLNAKVPQEKDPLQHGVQTFTGYPVEKYFKDVGRVINVTAYEY